MDIRRTARGGRSALALEIAPALGLALAEHRALNEAEAVIRPALEMARQVLPATDPNLGDLLVALGSLLVERGDAEEAEPIVREGLGVLRVGTHVSRVRIADAERVLAASLLAQGRRSEAEPLLLASLDTQRRLNNLRARTTAVRLVRLYEAGGQARQAAAQTAFLARIDADAVTELARAAAATTRRE